MPIDFISPINGDIWYKHRAWDLLNNVMHYDVEFMLINNWNGEYGVIFQSDIREHDFSEWPPKNEFEQRLAIMDYIKVKDINAKKIYDNDLVRVLGEGKDYLGVVVFSYKSGSPFVVDVNDWPNPNKNYSYFGNPKLTFEVVGNIFENPEMCPNIKQNTID